MGDEALGQREEKHGGEIVTIKLAESIVREKLCLHVCACVPGGTKAPLCCPVQMPVHQHRAAVPDSAASPSALKNHFKSHRSPRTTLKANEISNCNIL